MSARGSTRRCRASSRAAGGVLRLVSGRCQRFRGAARRHRKLALNDASFSYEMETSAALGFWLPLRLPLALHLEVIRDRLEREYDLDLITTAPSVVSSCI